MKVNCQKNKDITFSGFYNSNALKKGLEFAANNGTLFAATTTLALSPIRPLVILATPNTDKKNKQIACAKSLSSSINGYIIALACSRPFSRAINKIDKNPEQFLSKETMNELKDVNKKLVESKPYILATQLFKLGLGLLIAGPKAVLNAIGTPYVLKLFEKDDKNNRQSSFENIENITFQGKDKLPTLIGKIINNEKLKNFVIKNKDSNFPMHIVATTDTISTAVFINQIKQCKKLNDKDKKPLIYNTFISTALSIISTYIIDALTKKSTDNFIEKFKEINKNDKNLNKYIEGIKIAKPILLAGLIYYIIIPLLSTFLADRIKLSTPCSKQD